MDVIATKVFQLDINGDELPFELLPAKGEEGAIVGNWRSADDEEFYTSFLPNLRPGIVVAAINGKPVQFELFDDLLDIIALTAGRIETVNAIQVLFERPN